MTTKEKIECPIARCRRENPIRWFFYSRLADITIKWQVLKYKILKYLLCRLSRKFNKLYNTD